MLHKDFPSNLFVYGTLKSTSAPNAEQKFLLKNSIKMGNGSIPGRLYRINDNYPGAVVIKGSKERVRGEIYNLKRPTVVLKRLDIYEGCSPKDTKPTEFKRVLQSVQMDNKEFVFCWVYLYNKPVSGLEKQKGVL